MKDPEIDIDLSLKAHIYRAILLLALPVMLCLMGWLNHMDDSDKVRRNEIVMKSSAVQELKEKYTYYEASNIHSLSMGIVALKEFNEGYFRGWFLRLPGLSHTAACMKHIYGADGEKVLKSFHVSVEQQLEVPPEDCFRYYNTKKMAGIR